MTQPVSPLRYDVVDSDLVAVELTLLSKLFKALEVRRFIHA